MTKLSIDFEQSRAFVSGKPIELTATQFRILQLLAKKAGKLVTKEDITRALWDHSPYDRTPNAVEKQISLLRKKISRKGGLNYIRTAPHGYKGYILEAYCEIKSNLT